MRVKDHLALYVVQMHLVAPMGGLNFKVTLRNLPPIKSIAFNQSLQQPKDQLEHILQDAKASSQKGVDTVTVLVETHSKLQSALKAQSHQHVSIAFHGLDTGSVEVDFSDVRAAQEASITGLEASARQGKGYAIQPFQQRMPQVPFDYERDPHSSNTGTRLCPHMLA